jgi:hypothetical protein
MAFLLFPLRGVPEDEAFEIRDLLRHHAIDFYETNAGNWGMSMPAIWLRDEVQIEQAQALLQQYHQFRYRSQREAYLAKKANGKHKTLWQSFLQAPLIFGGYVFVIGLIFYVTIKLLLEIGL